MSVTSLINKYGRDVTLRRRTFGKTTMGGEKTFGELSSTVRLLIQNGGGSKTGRYGAERVEFGVVAFAKGGTDIVPSDIFDYGGETYRVETVRTPDERQAGDALRYVICGVSKTEGFP